MHLFTIVAFVALGSFNGYILLKNPFFARRSAVPLVHKYTYIGEDHPLEYPIAELDTVAMTLHESVRFMVNRTDPISADEFALVSSVPKGIGRIHVGPRNRVFLVAISHQLHCLRRMQLGFVNRDDPQGMPEHINHCLNYLRQTLLCDAAASLEAGDFLNQDFETDRVGSTLICPDWETAFRRLDERYEEWNSRDGEKD